ncbi:GNAT family N-acetyltransferase [Leucobacter sp. wl10]|uniref:GNAT family N-acetyltransferase n=1 Tax=Leucobacter sp. wl10 TaxID=2304677 RepID=UPI000E5AA5AA|nr:GNAT family N-acetyltransferase [Leucobacter sp. wl10]RGE21952.1 GNAT family N-acetyltransferase [Leucobacter sp. wl10]
MARLPTELSLRIARSIDDIPARTFYGVARLRQEVFVVEQGCVYLDLDGRDLESTAVQLWAEAADGEVAATVRTLDESRREPGLRSIGRVVTAPAWRGRGVAAALLEAAIAECAGGPILIHAQAHLEAWYERFGFAASGEGFLEDGIPHLPMRIG